MKYKALREIYREAFGDDGGFEDRLFSICGEYLRSVSCGEEAAAMLFALPCKIDVGKESFDAYYLYAAATKKKYRGRGYMSGLIEELKKHIKIEPVRQNDGKLKGKSFCFTGKLKHNRKYYEDLVNINGGQIKSVVKALDYLVVGEDAGSKLERARGLGIKTIKEEEFLDMVLK